MKTNKLYQISTLNALMLGDYKGSCKVGDLLKIADTGIGTYDGLNGEAIFLDGVAYDGMATGSVKVMKETDTLPFATVAKFNENVEENKIDFASISEFKEKMNEYIKNGKNYFYMIKMEGIFNVRVRSCFKQKEPYELLFKVAKDQREFEYQNEEGYVIGIYSPDYVEGMNLPGWHIHFISKKHTYGGHILEVSTKNAKMKINLLDEWDVILPHDDEFPSLNLKEDLKSKTEAVEGSHKKL